MDYIYSVRGKIDISKLGVALTHEHVMSRFGLERAYIPEYDKDSLFSQVIPYLKEVKALGVNSIFDCTTAYFGRNVSLLKEISDPTGVEIITNSRHLKRKIMFQDLHFSGKRSFFIKYCSHMMAIPITWTGYLRNTMLQ